MEFKEIQKQDRVYLFHDIEVKLTDIVKIHVSKSGTHRLEDEVGLKYIVPTGWRMIQFTAKEWTF